MAVLTEKFNDQTRGIPLGANHFALERCHPEIQPEHLLLALLFRPQGGIVRLFESLNIDLNRTYTMLEQLIKPGRGPQQRCKLPMSPAARSVFDFALDESKRLHHEMVGTEHLLLALLREPIGITKVLFAKMGLTLGTVRKQVARLFPPTPPPEGIAENAKLAALASKQKLDDQVWVNTLEDQVQRWQEARTLRMLVADVKARAKKKRIAIQPASPLGAWIKRVERLAHFHDPIPSLLAMAT